MTYILQVPPKTPIILAVDIEPALRRTHRPGAAADWDAFLRCLEWLRELRPKLEAVTGAPARFSWFLRLDPQIAGSYGSASWPIDRFRDQLRELEASGDEIGVHPHMWRWDDHGHQWFIDQQDHDWIAHCIELSKTAFEDALGRSPTLIRMGDHWLDGDAVSLIERLGFEYDLTIEPGCRGQRARAPDRGELPDYRRALRLPYSPAGGDFLQPRSPGPGPLTMVPITTGSFGLRRVLNHFRQGRFVQAWNLALATRFVRHLTDVELARSDNRVPVVVGRTGDASFPRSGRNFRRNLAYLAGHEALNRYVFTTPAEAVRSYRGTPSPLSRPSGGASPTPAV